MYATSAAAAPEVIIQNQAEYILRCMTNEVLAIGDGSVFSLVPKNSTTASFVEQAIQFNQLSRSLYVTQHDDNYLIVHSELIHVLVENATERKHPNFHCKK